MTNTMIYSKDDSTPVERRTTRDVYTEEIDRLKLWLKIIKDVTLDGAIIASVDLALEGRTPLPEDYRADGMDDNDELQILWEPTNKIENW